jgi:Bacteriophage tail sheath protein
VEPDTELPDPPAIPLGLDGRDPASLAEIVARQRRLVQIADLWRRFVVLLDVPTGIALHRVTGWRSAFDSSYAAAYFPWLGVVPPGSGEAVAVSVPPSGFAAGIIAAREIRRGIAWGPANELAVGAVVAREPVTDALHDRLHLMGINVYRAERDGFRLSAARTLANDPEYRQLSVRRLMTMIALTITQQSQWLVFEPNTADLRRRLALTITALLRDLHRRGFLAGRTEVESFFVRCDDSNNPVRSQALGRLVAEVGVAPAAPLEYLLLVVSADTAGGVRVEERRA